MRSSRAVRPAVKMLVLSAGIAALFPLASPARAVAACITARQVFAVREAAGVPLRQPSDLVLAGERLLVLDDLNGRIAVLDRQRGGGLGAIPLPGPAGSSWLGIGFGGADQVFAASSGAGRIVVLDLKGKVALEFPAGESGARPAGVLISRGNCFVADNGSHKVRSFSLDGKPLAAWGGLGESATQFRAPFRVAQDSLDRLLVTDSLNSRVLAFTPKGEPLASFGEFGTTEGTLFRPTGLAVLDDDRVLVSDAYFGSIQMFDARGVYQGVLCAEAGRPLALGSPMGLAVRGRTVYVVEMAAGQVSAWEIGGR